MTNPEQEKKPKWLSIAAVILFFAPQLFIPLVFLGAIGYIIFASIKGAKSSASSQKTTYTTPADKLDECPKPLFCFHKDKGEHHVRRGKEMDPWDRPDIDIRKYQRKD